MHIVESWIHELLLFLVTPDRLWQFCTMPFWALFTAFFGVYLVFRGGRRTLLLGYVVAFNLFFAWKANGLTALLLPLTACVSWWLVERMKRCEGWRRRTWLWLTVLLLLAPLVYYKYAGFLAFNFSLLLRENFPVPQVVLPIGISFYTFQAISYAADVYRRRYTASTSLLDYLFYLTFFPLLLAGPITRAGTLLPQLRQFALRRTLHGRLTGVRVQMGLFLIVLGLLKKGLIADYIAQYNNWIFDTPLAYSGFENVMGALGYTLQIYCDFSGYSDISIGLAALMGFRLPLNFNAPYQSLNLSDFWRRWHISLSSWLRDYVYIPLGGNRCGKFRTYFNNFLTMLVAGIWHGASWMFVLWGALHGVGLIVHKALLPLLRRIPEPFFVRLLCRMLTMTFLVCTWVVFRAETWEVVAQFFSNVGATFSWDYLVPFVKARPVWTVLLLLGFALHYTSPRGYGRLRHAFVRLPWLLQLVVFLAAVLLVINFSQDNVQPFIYSRF